MLFADEFDVLAAERFLGQAAAIFFRRQFDVMAAGGTLAERFEVIGALNLFEQVLQRGFKRCNVFARELFAGRRQQR